MLWLAIVSGAYRETLTWASACYLLGGLVGLFNRLYVEHGQDKEIDDFGLSTTRLVTMPILAGVAALLGLVLFSLTTASVQLTSAGPLTLESIFDIGKHPFSIVAAAAFGLTPGLLIDHLSQNTEEFKSKLKSTELHFTTNGCGPAR